MFYEVKERFHLSALVLIAYIKCNILLFKLFYFFHDLYILTYTLQSIQANMIYFTFFLRTSGMKDFRCIYIYI